VKAVIDRTVACILVGAIEQHATVPYDAKIGASFFCPSALATSMPLHAPITGTVTLDRN
jgi:hypothetical protein